MDFSASRNMTANVTRKRCASDNARVGFLFSTYRVSQPSSAAYDRATRTRGYLLPLVVEIFGPRKGGAQKRS